MNVSEFNCQGIMRAYDAVQGEYGGSLPQLVESIDVWMKFEYLGGSTQPQFAQMMSDVTARATMRYNPAFTTNWLLEFEGKIYTIAFIKLDTANQKRFMVIDLRVSLTQTSWS